MHWNKKKEGTAVGDRDVHVHLVVFFFISKKKN